MKQKGGNWGGRWHAVWPASCPLVILPHSSIWLEPLVTAASAGSSCNPLDYILYRGYRFNKPRGINGLSLQISPDEFFTSCLPQCGPISWSWRVGGGGPVRDTPTREGLELRGAGVFSLGPAAEYTTGLPSLECTLLSEFCHPQMPLWTSSRPLWPLASQNCL